MPRRSILTASEKESLIAIPESEEEIIQHYTLSETDLSIIRQHRGAANRLGFAVQLCCMRYPGIAISSEQSIPDIFLEYLANQLDVAPEVWSEYGRRQETRREYLLELQSMFDFELFSMKRYDEMIDELHGVAEQTDKGIVIASTLVQNLRRKNILLPAINVIERMCAEAITRANRDIYSQLSDPLTLRQRQQLDQLLKIRSDSSSTYLAWLRQSPMKSNSKAMLEHIERLRLLHDINLPLGIERTIHQNRLLKMAREGGQMTPANLSKFEPNRRYATLVALVIEAIATLIDEIIELHDKIIGKLFNTAKHKHEKEFQSSGKAINDKVRLYNRIGQALLDAKQTGTDPYKAIESIMSWDKFSESVDEAGRLAKNEDFDFIHRIAENYPTIRRYVPDFLGILKLRAAPAAEELLQGIELLRKLYSDNARKVPDDAPTAFVRRRWSKLVFTSEGIDRRNYELCLLTELKNALRSGDIWVRGSRQFKDFDEYLLTGDAYSSLKEANKLGISVDSDCECYINQRLAQLEERLNAVNMLAQSNELPDAIITNNGLKITPFDAVFPDDAQSLIQNTAALLPHVKITELLIEVDSWTGFSRHFTHIKNDQIAKDTTILLTAILADGINLGLSKMAESCPGTTYSKLSWLQAWHIRDETYSQALGELTNAQLKHPFALNWGDGKTSSSDGQRFRAGNKAQSTGHINPKYGSEPGRLFYTHISDQYSPFSARLVNVGVRDSTYVLDGLLYHESDLRIEEHYTDTAGFTDHVFALMHLLGFRFAPRIRDLADTKIYIPDNGKKYDALKPMIGGTLGIKNIKMHWDEILRLAGSIKKGTVTASLMLRKLGSYPRQNGLAIALRELGRIERTLFILDWLQNVELRRRVQAGLNKGEARNALARAVFLNRLGEIRDRSFDQQRYRASGLTLLTSAIVLWNTVYLERAVAALRNKGETIDDSMLQYLSPLGWEHINLTGDYVWKKSSKLKDGKFRPLRAVKFS
ncbi:Tn3 family transposase [Sulfuricurvum sp.]|uniref:Tn3 family transposase n=1 Tax=Sulfuricurvum sp. TaxID=2025608 RepID=UPI00262F8C1F|nr:Tn3 family transposase [Sulfuricurvum sp.]MDD3596291.1 Tn3 family transposase [Sulfuricurvum sp.]MDD4950835.1 Tn3 family transposase [Sulfuricurvum sp.]